jgi:hypothetical protein
MIFALQYADRRPILNPVPVDYEELATFDFVKGPVWTFEPAVG